MFVDNIWAATCFNPTTVCVEQGGTRYFDGVPVKLECWHYRTTYDCKVDSDNNCKELKEQGCSPASATCKTMWGNACAVKEVIYDCPTRKCDGSEIVCNNPDAFCATGNCVPHERGKDKDMNNALAALSAAAEAAHHLDASNPDQLKIFGGKSRECSRSIARSITKDCCGINASGYLEGKLLICDPEELETARAKEAGRAVELGEYCREEVAGLCISHHKTFCVFQSKLARIIQTAARSQLGISFGGPESSNCRALTQDEFQKIDFSRVDFSDFYKDIEDKAKQESEGDVTARAKQAASVYKQQADAFKGNVEKIRDKMQSKMKDTQVNTEKLTEDGVTKRETENKTGW